jgi:Bacterial regulatory proteins, tetR family
MPLKNEKDEKYWKILNSCIRLELRHGHLKWTMAALHRESKVSRPLIYYYFGRSKKNIILEACHYFGVLLSGTDQLKMKLYDENQVAKALLESKELLIKSPDLVSFYFMHRHSKNEIGELIRSYERKGIKKREKFLKNEKDAVVLFALHMGISLCSQIYDLEGIQSCLEALKIDLNN